MHRGDYAVDGCMLAFFTSATYPCLSNGKAGRVSAGLVAASVCRAGLPLFVPCHLVVSVCVWRHLGDCVRSTAALMAVTSAYTVLHCQYGPFEGINPGLLLH